MTEAMKAYTPVYNMINEMKGLSGKQIKNMIPQLMVAANIANEDFKHLDKKLTAIELTQAEMRGQINNLNTLLNMSI